MRNPYPTLYFYFTEFWKALGAIWDIAHEEQKLCVYDSPEHCTKKGYTAEKDSTPAHMKLTLF